LRTTKTNKTDINTTPLFYFYHSLSE
jgi:hypothetical protein